MTSFRRVFALVGHGAASDAALPFAFDLAERLRARITVVHAVALAELAPPRAPRPADELRAMREAESSAAERVARTLGGEARAFDTMVGAGSPLDAVACLGVDDGSALIVTGHPIHRGLLDRFALGDELSAVCTRSPLPVVVVPCAGGAPPLRLPAGRPLALSSTVGPGLVGARAYAAACALAHDLDGSVHVERRARAALLSRAPPRAAGADLLVVEAAHERGVRGYLDERALARLLADAALPTVVVPSCA